MKIRNGFVSNSSTSSFTCGVCGEVEAGMDLCLSECGMQSCVNGHSWHTECASVEWDVKEALIEAAKDSLDGWEKELDNIEGSCYTEEDIQEYINTDKELLSRIPEMDNDDCMEEGEERFEFSYEVPEAGCPFCNFQHLDSDDVVKYLYKKMGKDNKQVKEEIKSQFNTYKCFKNYLNEE